ncbi:hypothetical protein B0J18DRAFT_245943 [Chaetomium sp. MPI-SDFR-AT-0129]|nr:hypothetical protein B0J18DRAFT_245943 [Chaetomium sp. MPI-SDFR-AT-0129]
MLGVFSRPLSSSQNGIVGCSKLGTCSLSPPGRFPGFTHSTCAQVASPSEATSLTASHMLGSAHDPHYLDHMSMFSRQEAIINQHSCSGFKRYHQPTTHGRSPTPSVKASKRLFTLTSHLEHHVPSQLIFVSSPTCSANGIRPGFSALGGRDDGGLSEAAHRSTAPRPHPNHTIPHLTTPSDINTAQHPTQPTYPPTHSLAR